LLNVTFFIHKNSFLEKLNKKVKQAEKLIAAANLPALYRNTPMRLGAVWEKIKKMQNCGEFVGTVFSLTLEDLRAKKPKATTGFN
jgi:hypothetical protein